MALTPLSVSDNPQQPSIFSEIYLPDQLIAGNLKIVSERVTVTGAAVLKRGTVLGQATLGTVVTAPGKLFGSGTIVVAAVPADGDTLTVQGTAITMKAIPSGNVDFAAVGNQVIIPASATTATMAQALLSFLQGSTDANISKMSYALSGSTITATSLIPGVAGNAYTLATSNAAAFTVPSTLSGGTANAGAETIGSVTLGLAAKPGQYQVILTSTTVGYVLDPNGDAVGNGFTVGTAFTSSEVNFTVTTGSGIAAADAFVINAYPNAAGLWKISTAAAVDGSQNAAAILADYCDPTGGNVVAGIYIMGEFNQRAVILDPSMSMNAVTAALRARSIFLKSSVSSLPEQ